MTQTNESVDVVARPLRHYGRWFSAVLIAALLGALVWSLVTAPSINHSMISKYMFDPLVVDGARTTVILTVISMSIAIVLAIFLAVMKLSTNPVLRVISSTYIQVFRGTPLLVQVVFWGYLGLIYSDITISVPFTHHVLWSRPTSDAISAFTAGVIALALNEAAYAAEVVRAGIQDVDKGQFEAADALGFSRALTMRRVVLPQAMRTIVPALGNETIGMLKNTALLEVLNVLELYTRTQHISSQNLAQVELLIVAAVWYMAMTTVLSVPQRWLEKYFGRGTAQTPSSKRWLKGSK